jgi:hypothetical protein
MIQTHQGACHCRRITFEVLAELNYVVDCNCSICRRKGALWHPAADADLRVLTGEADLVLYQFNTKTAKHYFCRHCGIHPFIRPRLDPSRWAFNVRCIDAIDLSSIKVRPFDGQNWEATAKAYHDRLRKPPAG